MAYAPRLPTASFWLLESKLKGHNKSVARFRSLAPFCQAFLGLSACSCMQKHVEEELLELTGHERRDQMAGGSKQMPETPSSKRRHAAVWLQRGMKAACRRPVATPCRTRAADFLDVKAIEEP